MLSKKNTCIDFEQQTIKFLRIQKSIDASRNVQKIELDKLTTAKKAYEADVAKLVDLKKSLDHQQALINRREELFATEWQLIKDAKAMTGNNVAATANNINNIDDNNTQISNNTGGNIQYSINTGSNVQNGNNTAKKYVNKATMTLPPAEVRRLFFEQQTIAPNSRTAQRANRKKGRLRDGIPKLDANPKMDAILKELTLLRQQQQGDVQQPQYQQQPQQQLPLQQQLQQQYQHQQQQQPYLQQQYPQNHWRDQNTSSLMHRPSDNNAQPRTASDMHYRSAPYIEGQNLNRYLQSTPYAFAPNM